MVHRPPLPPHPAPILRGSTACCAHVDLESANLKIYQVLPFSHAPCCPFPSDILGGDGDGSCMAQTRLSVTPWLCSIPAPGQGVLGGWGGGVGAFLSHPPSPPVRDSRQKQKMGFCHHLAAVPAPLPRAPLWKCPWGPRLPLLFWGAAGGDALNRVRKARCKERLLPPQRRGAPFQPPEWGRRRLKGRAPRHPRPLCLPLRSPPPAPSVLLNL